MLREVIRFVRLPLLLVLIAAVARFLLGLSGFPYAPRGNAIFSVRTLTIISCLYFGALSRRAGFTWAGSALVGVVIGLFAQILIFVATWISYTFYWNTYYVHWDALNAPEGAVLPLADALKIRAQALITGPIFDSIVALIGRALGRLIPEPRTW